MPGKRWRPLEDYALRRCAEQGADAATVRAALPGRTYPIARRRARKLRLAWAAHPENDRGDR